MTDPRGYIGTKTDGHGDAFYGGGPQVHNYFPDGKFVNPDNVAVGVHNWANGSYVYAANGTETLSVVTGGHPDGGNLARSVTAGSNFGEGIYLYSPPDISAGSFSLAFDLHVQFPNGVLSPYPRAAIRVNNDNATGANQITYLVANEFWQRIIVPLTCYGTDVGTLTVAITSDPASFTNEGDASVVVQFDVGNVMFTEYDGSRYRDGDSDGWVWSGTPNASISYGPKP